MAALRHPLCFDFLNMQAHRLCVAVRQDESCAFALFRTNGAQKIARGPDAPARMLARKSLRAGSRRRASIPAINARCRTSGGFQIPLPLQNTHRACVGALNLFTYPIAAVSSMLLNVDVQVIFALSVRAGPQHCSEPATSSGTNVHRGKAAIRCVGRHHQSLPVRASRPRGRLADVS